MSLLREERFADIDQHCKVDQQLHCALQHLYVHSCVMAPQLLQGHSFCPPLGGTSIEESGAKKGKTDLCKVVFVLCRVGPAVRSLVQRMASQWNGRARLTVTPRAPLYPRSPLCPKDPKLCMTSPPLTPTAKVGAPLISIRYNCCSQWPLKMASLALVRQRDIAKRLLHIEHKAQ